MKKMLVLLVMAVLSMSAMASGTDYYPAWWEKLEPNVKITEGNYEVMTAVSEDVFTPQTVVSELKYSSGTHYADINQKLVTSKAGTQTGVDRQLTYQAANAWTFEKDHAYDAENPAKYISKQAGFDKTQWASFSGDLADPQFKCPAFTVTFQPGTVDSSVGVGGIDAHERDFGDVTTVKNYATGANVHIIEAFGRQDTGVQATQVTTQLTGVPTPVTQVFLDGYSSLSAGFRNAVMAPGHENELEIDLNTAPGLGDHFWWD